MTYQRPSGGYTSTSTTVNARKYQNDSATGTAISSEKVDGDMNYIIDSLNELGSDVSSVVSGSLPGQSGNAGLPLFTNGSTTTFGQLNASTAIIDNTIAGVKILDGTLTTAKYANLSVTTNKIADEAVGLQKIADGPAGSILHWDASGEAASLPVGSDGQFLSVLGGVPSWVTSVFPVGMVITWPVTTPLNGWLLMDGTSYSKTAYPALYNLLRNGGPSCIYGEDATTFKLPDMRGRFVRGFDPTATIDVEATSRTDRGDGTVGNVIGTKQEDGIADGEATLSIIRPDTASSSGDTAIGITNGSSKDTQFLATRDKFAETSDTVKINGTADETRPINITMNYLIKAQ